MKFYQRFRVSLGIYSMLIIIIPMVISTLIIMSSSSRTMERQILEQNALIVSGMKNTITSQLDGGQAMINALAKSDEVTGLNPNNMDSVLSEMVNESSIISQLYVMDKTGMQIYKTSGDLGDRSTREYFQKAIKGEGNFSDVLISGSTGMPIVVYAYPVMNGDKVVGVLGGSIDLTFISELANMTKIGIEGYGYIVDSNGILIGHPVLEKVTNMEDVSSIYPVAQAINRVEGVGEYTYEGHSKLAAYSYEEETGWGIIAQLPYDEAFRSIMVTRWIVFGLIVLFSVIGLIVTFFASGTVTRPLKHLQQSMGIVQEGNLNIQLDKTVLNKTNEFGLLARGFNSMISNISKVIRSSKSITDELGISSERLSEISADTQNLSLEITRAIEEIAQGAGDQAIEAEKSAQLVAKFDSSFKELSQSSESMNGEVRQVANINEASRESLRVLNQTSEINKEKTLEVEKAIAELDKQSADIINILNTITSISEQTNLLALNASIEAARAGEHGKGFAVVAGEIGKLAEGSNEAAKEIGNIINNIQSEIKQTVGLMQEVKEASDAQVESVEGVSESFDNINKSIGKITDSIVEINDFVRELNEDNTRIVDSISNISSVSEESAAGAEEVSASVTQQLDAIEEIAKEANLLQEKANRLKSDIDIFEV